MSAFNELVLDFLQSAYAGQPHAPKRLARAAQSSHRTAENWLARLNAPSGERLALLLTEHPDLEKRVVQHIAERRRMRAQSAQSAAASRARLAIRRGETCA